MCDKCGDAEELTEYMNEMQSEVFGEGEWNLEPVALLSAASKDGSVMIAQEADVATIDENGVTVKRVKTVVIIPPDKLTSLSMFLISQAMRNRGVGDEHEHEG